MQDLIVKHLSGNTSPNEDKVLFDWLNADAKHQAEFDLQKKLWDIFEAYDESVPEINLNKAWENFSDKMDHESSKNKRFFALKLASVFIVLLISGTFILNFKTEKQNKNVAQKTESKIPVTKGQLQANLLSENNEEVVVLKPIHKKYKSSHFSSNVIDSTYTDEYALVDSSSAYLTASSVLTALDQTPHQNRLVSLSGAGLFNIKPSNKDFQLETEDLIIKVQGTKFNVQKSTVFDNVIEISVEEGEMDVQEKNNPSNSITITANQTYHFDKATHQFKLASSAEEKSKKSVFYKLFQKK